MKTRVEGFMKRGFLLVLTMFSAQIALAQADTPCAAPLLTLGTSCNYVTHDASLDTKGTTAIAPNPTCGFYTSAVLAFEDTWYAFVAPAGGAVIISTNQIAGSAYPYASAAVYTGTACTSLTQTDCFNGYGGVAYPSFSLTGLTPGQTYYVRFWGLLPTAGLPKTHGFCAWAPPSPPVNDECDDAIPAAVNPDGFCNLVTPGTIAGATQSSESYYCNFAGGGNANDDVWFSFVAENSTQYVQFENIVGVTAGLSYSIHVGTFCNTTGVNSLACNNVVNGLTVGATYYVRVWSNSNSAENVSFDLCITSPPPMPVCGVNPVAGNTACTATPICNLNGYCGTTSGTYTVDTWPALTSAANACFPDIDNNSFLELTATATSISFYVWVSNCNFPNGIQIMVFSADSCDNSPITVHQCWSPAFVPVAATLISASGLTVGETYYIMVDGNAGAICDYVIAAHEGFLTGVEVATVIGDTSLCQGSSVDLYATGGFGNYSWSPSTGLSNTTNDTVTATPATPGPVTYTVTSTSNNPICPNDTSDITLLVTNEVMSTDVQTSCGPFTWIDGNTYATNNTTAMDTIIGGSNSGCDSIITLNLTITNAVTSTDVQTSCGSYTWIDGNTYSSNNNTAMDTIIGGAANGCDSIISLNLTITNAVMSTDVQTACGSFTWIDGNTYSSNNTTAMDTIVGGAANSCDSIISLSLTITNAVMSTDVQTACGSFTWIDGNTYSSNNTTAMDTIIGGAANSCDSIITLSLTITNAVMSTDVQTACGSFTWIDGNTYSSNNTTAMDTIIGGAANGCDSIITLSLTITNAIMSTDVLTACGSFTWIDGNTYSSNNTTAMDTIIGGAANGCDSIITLSLTITNAVMSTDVQTSCGSYTWIDGNTYSSNNTTAMYTIIGGAANGCDSIITLNLTITNDVNILDPQTACDAFTWIDGMTYNTSTNTPTFTVVNPGGCDTIYTLNLVINNSQASTDVQTSCAPFVWIDGNEYNANNNIATVTLTGANACDSIVTLDLTILATPNVNPMALEDTILLGEETLVYVSNNGFDYQWSNGGNGDSVMISPSSTTTYSVVASNGPCVDTGSIQIVVVDEDLNLLIPTAFSPNADGLNDLFRIVNLEDFSDVKMQIYNRWGELIFEGEDNDHAWDGTYKSKAQALDVYVYSIKATAKKNGESFVLSGNVTLIR